MTVGCKLNQYETQLLTENFELNGFRVLPWGERTDVVVVNTCSVTSRAEATARNLINRAARLSPKPYLAVTGCYAKRQTDRLCGIHGVDLVGSQEEILQTLLGSSERVNQISHFDGHTRAFVKVQDGCDNFCTFCVLPHLRGGPRSRPVGKVADEISRLCASGYSEIVLTGINIGNYSNDATDLVGLLERLEALSMLRRLRLSSIEPTHVDGRLIDYILSSRKFCRHLHIPLQSGDASVLKLMGRRYSPQDYSTTLRRLNQSVPEMAIGADVIVGFPGEDERSFDNTFALVADLPISYLHVFRYSEREETPSSRFGGKVSEEEKKKRCNRLIGLGRQKWYDYRSSFVGRKLEVLVEHRRDAHSGKLVGMASQYVRILLDGDDCLMGRYVPVAVESVGNKYSYGRILEE